MNVVTKTRRGQSLVEFALAVPVIAVMLIGLTEFGFVLYAHVQVANAVREGARAGSLYLGSRFHYTSCVEDLATSGTDCPTGYGQGDGTECWSLRDWVENALVERERAANGCDIDPPVFNYTKAADGVHAFGRLDPTWCGDASPGADCWDIATLTVAGSAGPSSPSDSDSKWLSENVGKSLRVEVVYNYTMPFAGSLLPILDNPIQIRRSVIMMVQNN
ncbi:MAG: pilus assembly protein [Chloroflexota bacterium]|nr:pilus assembly protein [Chloroflexota bacterium]